MALKIVIGILLVIALLVAGAVWYLSTSATGKQIWADAGTPFTPKPGSTTPGSTDNLGDYIAKRDS